MGKLLLVWRLAVKDLLHNAAEAVLLLLAVAAATAAMTLGLALHGVTNAPYARTQAATHGPDVVANVSPGGPNPSAPIPAKVMNELHALEHEKGIVASSGPFPVTWAVLGGRSSAIAEIEGRRTAPATVDQPRLTAGNWVRSGGVVVEAGFASALGLNVGDQIRLAGIPFHVVGKAVTAALPSYGRLCVLGCYESLDGQPGLVWSTTADATRVAHAAKEPIAYDLNLRLTHPAEATTFANRFDAAIADAPNAPYLFSWQEIANADAKVIANVQLVFFTGSVLLVLLALASVAVLVGGRMAEQSRRVGLVKAVGGTPKFVAAVLVLENVLIGVGAAAVGLLLGWLVAPVLDRPGAGLLGAAGAPAIGLASIGLVLGLAVAVSVAATFVPTVRAARTSTVRLLD
ncbi:MAG: ABC transporter permease, partial [Acidimicrobiales bacterium]